MVFLLAVGLSSCEETDNFQKDLTYSEYLNDKSIHLIRIFNGDIWVSSTNVCDTCYVAPQNSRVPLTAQLIRINNSGFDYEEPTNVSAPVADNRGNLYVSGNLWQYPYESRNKLFRVKAIGKYELVLETGDFYFDDFAFDRNNNIWFHGHEGIAFYNGSDLKVYDTSNSMLPTNINHGLAIGKDGIVWVALDHEGGLLKITGDKWEFIPYANIPGNISYLSNPIVDNENNIWFRVSTLNRTDTKSDILRFDGRDWYYEYIGHGDYTRAMEIDSEGIIWVITFDMEYSHEGYPITKSSDITYYQDEAWTNFDIGDIRNTEIFTLNADSKRIYIGTGKGMKVIEK